MCAWISVGWFGFQIFYFFLGGVGGVLAYWMSTLHLKFAAASLLPSASLRLFQWGKPGKELWGEISSSEVLGCTRGPFLLTFTNFLCRWGLLESSCNPTVVPELELHFLSKLQLGDNLKEKMVTVTCFLGTFTDTVQIQLSSWREESLLINMKFFWLFIIHC